MSIFHFPFLRGNDGYNDLEYTELQDHEELSERFRKTFYYGKQPTTDRPSLPLTNLTVDFLNAAVPKKLGKVDHYFAASSARHSCMSPCSMVMGMIYVNRLKKKNTDYLQQVSSSDLFLISMMMASKFLYDEGVDDEVFNDEWAASADMETEDVNELERQFLSAIDWQLYVNEEEFYQVLQRVERRIAMTEGIERGWFSYTDLWVISKDPQLLQTYKEIANLLPKMLSVTMVAYIAGILTMVGSTLLVTTALSTLATLTPHTLPSKEHTILPVPNHMYVSMEDGPLPEEGTVPTATEEHKTRPLDGTLTSLWTLLTLPSILSLSNPGQSGQATRAKQSMHSAHNTTNLDDDSDKEPKDDLGDSKRIQFFKLFKDLISFSFPEVQKSTPVSNQMVCAKGPCLFSGQNINCKNISKPQNNWLISSLWKPMDFEQTERDRVKSRCKDCGARTMPNSGRPDRFCDTRTAAVDRVVVAQSDVSCCCDHVTADLDRSLLLNGFADISLGFRTMLTEFPLFGT